VDKVQSAKIGAERRGSGPSSVQQFLVRIGKKAGWLSTAELKQRVVSLLGLWPNKCKNCFYYYNSSYIRYSIMHHCGLQLMFIKQNSCA
jgi:hypothetical protein